jgi:hypothetical protein
VQSATKSTCIKYSTYRYSSVQRQTFSQPLHHPQELFNCWDSAIMNISYGQTFLVSLVGSVLLTRLAPQYAPFAAWFINFLALYIPIFGTVLVAKAFVYPFLLSPLRNLPMPEVRTATQIWTTLLTNLLSGRISTIWTIPKDFQIAIWNSISRMDRDSTQRWPHSIPTYI